MKFLCDQMLIRLGKWLRAAGYDTLIIETSIDDAEIYALAVKEERLLITRDRHFLEMRDEGARVVWLESNELEACAEELSRRISINWLLKPFSRCILCNTPFVAASEEDLAEVPEDVVKSSSVFCKCLKCSRVFWLGSHTDRMLRQLEMWQSRPS